jgi:hypothetical protein
MAGLKDQPLERTPGKEDPRRSRENDASRVHAVAEGAVPGLHYQDVARPNPVEP